MGIVFLNPPRPQLQLMGLVRVGFPVYRFNRGVDVTHTTVVPPTELASLAAAVDEAGYETAIIDANALELTYEETRRVVLAARPDYLVIRAGWSTFGLDMLCHRFARERGIKTIVWENTLNPVYTENIVRDWDADRLMYGEPEDAIFRFLDGATGAICGGPVAGLDRLPLPQFQKLPMDRYKRRGRRWWYSLPQRGCRWGNCSFCLEHGNAPRALSMDRIQQEMEELKRWGMEGVFFWEPEANTNDRRLLELSEVMKNNGLNWECWYRPDAADACVMGKMAESGCLKLSIGVESGDQTVLDSLGKGVTVEQVRQTFRCARDAGIDTQAFHVVGTPYETRESCAATLRLLREIRPTLTAPISFIPFPNTPLARLASEEGLIVRDFYEAVASGDCMGEVMFCRPKKMGESELASWIGRFRRLESEYALKAYAGRPAQWGFALHEGFMRSMYGRMMRNGLTPGGNLRWPARPTRCV
jgi:anaerobic magnesium-protoporphyrin IX monomethyl ester cyclase